MSDLVENPSPRFFYYVAPIFFQDSPPGAERTSPWSADQLRKIESTLKPHNQRQGDADQSKASPLKKALKKGQNILSKYLQNIVTVSNLVQARLIA